MKKTPDYSKEYVKKNDSFPIAITNSFPDYDDWKFQPMSLKQEKRKYCHLKITGMKKIILALIVLLFVTSKTAFAQDFSKEEISQWQKQAKRITIIRDNWDLPHIYGKTDADCVWINVCTVRRQLL